MLQQKNGVKKGKKTAKNGGEAELICEECGSGPYGHRQSYLRHLTRYVISAYEGILYRGHHIRLKYLFRVEAH